MEFKLTSEYIELDNLLKVLDLVASGPEAKAMIKGRNVEVNGQIEERVRRKLKAGDRVVVAGKEVDIV
ncbi:MAG TPA: RNA-binding protein [Candidatus Omnitrophica bacterium]|nr:RNA-binding protein [Candidatus Omnitrophota bacterium]